MFRERWFFDLLCWSKWYAEQEGFSNRTSIRYRIIFDREMITTVIAKIFVWKYFFLIEIESRLFSDNVVQKIFRYVKYVLKYSAFFYYVFSVVSFSLYLRSKNDHPFRILLNNIVRIVKYNKITSQSFFLHISTYTRNI